MQTQKNNVTTLNWRIIQSTSITKQRDKFA